MFKTTSYYQGLTATLPSSGVVVVIVVVVVVVVVIYISSSVHVNRTNLNNLYNE